MATNAVLDLFTSSTLNHLKESYTYRTLKKLEGKEGAHIIYEGKRVLSLASNSYLDMTNVKEVEDAAAKAAIEWGTGSGGARLTTGNKTIHEELEQELAQFKNTESAILFNSGYMANVGTISALCKKGDFIFSDALNHASIIDGIRLSKANCFVYKHNDMSDLKQKIKDSSFCFKNGHKGLIVTDAVFSMDGDLANLPQLLEIAHEFQLLLMIDEAHATGVVGKTGRGLAEFYGCSHADVTLGTLSKSLGAEGGFVAGDLALIDFLRNSARSYIFTTAMSPIIATSALTALRFLKKTPARVLELQDLVNTFVQALRENGLNVNDSNAAIVPILTYDSARTLKIAEQLLNAGIFIPAIRNPTVPKDKARLRASIMATHKKSDLQNAAKLIASIMRKY